MNSQELFGRLRAKQSPHLHHNAREHDFEVLKDRLAHAFYRSVPKKKRKWERYADLEHFSGPMIRGVVKPIAVDEHGAFDKLVNDFEAWAKSLTDKAPYTSMIVNGLPRVSFHTAGRTFVWTFRARIVRPEAYNADPFDAWVAEFTRTNA